MKMIKLSDDHYIVVDDSQIVVGDWCYRDTEVVFQATKELLDYYNSINSKHKVYKITHSTQPLEDVGLNTSMGWQLGFDKIEPLYLSEVKELLGEVDVVELSKKITEHQKFTNGLHEEIVAQIYYRKGYNQALEDNIDKKYTEDDMIEWAMCMIAQYVHGNTNIWNKDLLRESLPKPKTEWEVEFVDGKIKLKQ